MNFKFTKSRRQIEVPLDLVSFLFISPFFFPPQEKIMTFLRLVGLSFGSSFNQIFSMDDRGAETLLEHDVLFRSLVKKIYTL